MRNIKLILFVLLFGLLKNANGQTSDSVVNNLLAIDEVQFINQPLDSIIAVLPSGYTSMRIVAPTHRYTARLVRVMYPNNVWIDLHVRDFVYMNPVDTNRIWDIMLMRRDKLYKTVIFKHTTCYRNCETY